MLCSISWHTDGIPHNRYKNPKSANKLREAAPASVERTMKSRYTPRSIPVNSEQFLSKSENQIPEHEVRYWYHAIYINVDSK